MPALSRLLAGLVGPCRRLARIVAAAGLVAFVVGSLPGARLRSAPAGRRAPGASGRDAGGVVEVHVRALAGVPLVGARVQAWAVSARGLAERAGEAATDATGDVRFVRVPRGEIWITADAAGRARASMHLVLGAEPRVVDLELGPAHALDLVLESEEGAPVPAGEVEVVSATDPLPVGGRSDAGGRAHIDRLGPGPWQVMVRVAGYEDTVARAEREGEPLTIVVRRLGAFRVHVVGAGEAPAAGARVFIAGPALWPPRAAETDEHGEVRIGGLPAGSYALRATKGDDVSPIELGVLLERGAEKPVDLRLGPGRFVRVRVTDGGGDDAPAIAGARLSLAEGGLSPFPLEATTDVQGRARLGPIGAGSATVSATAEGFVGGAAVPVDDLTPGSAGPETRIPLVRGGVLTGRVVDVHGRPVDGASLELAGTDLQGGPVYDDPRRTVFQAAHFAATLGGPAPLVAAGELGVLPGPVPPIPHAGPAGPPAVAESLGAPWVTRSDGTFRVAPATPGRIRVIVRHPQYVEAQTEVIALAPGGRAEVEIVLREGGAIEGRVLDAHDRPVAGARVFVAAVRGTLERTTRSASDGTFAFDALPDAVSLAVAPSDEDAPEIRLDVAVPEGGRREVVVRLPEERDPLPVVVVDARGWPVDAAQVTVASLSKDSLLRATVFTDDRGESQVPKARGLPLRVEVHAPSRAPRVMTTTGAEQGLRIELRPAESVTGQVVTARGGDPVAGAEVTLYAEGGARHARSDARGVFSFAEVAPGAARLAVRARGYASRRQRVDIPDSGGRGPFALPRLELAEEGVAEGEIVDARGEPVPGARVAVDHVPTWVLVGASPPGMVRADSGGRFRLGELAEGEAFLEAYAPGRGRGRAPVTIVAGRTVDRVRIALSGADNGDRGLDPAGTGSVAVTLGETAAPTQVLVVSVVDGSEAERAGMVPGDVLAAIDGAPVSSMADARARLSGPVDDDLLLTVVRGAQTLALRVAREPVRR